MKKYNWMPILKTGTFTAKNGKKVTFDEAALDKIIANTDCTKVPQFVIEHPSYDKLGFGGIQELKRIGQILLALPKTVEEKFKEAVNSGELPGRSCSLDENTLALSSVGFLPKNIDPAVDGLGTYAFSSDSTDAKLKFSLPDLESHFAEIENDKLEFQSYQVSAYPFKSIQSVFRNIKNFFIEKFGLDTAESIMPEYTIGDIGNPPTVYTTPDNFMNYSKNNGDNMSKLDFSKIDFSKMPADLKAIFDSMKTAVGELETELESKKVELQSATSKLTTTEKENLRKEVLQFCESDDVKLKILPADKEKAIQFLMGLKEKGMIELSMPDNSKIQFDAFDFAKSLIKSQPDKIELSATAHNNNAGLQTNHSQDTAKRMAESVNKNR